MDIKITPGLLAGKINAIPSKSHGHRLLISNTLAALCDLAGDSNVASALKSTETEKARAVIERSVNEIDTGHNSTDISATRECLLSLADQVPEMDCVENGSTLRFMMPNYIFNCLFSAFQIDQSIQIFCPNVETFLYIGSFQLRLNLSFHAFRKIQQK